MYYDQFGQSLIRIADATSLGFSTTLQNAGTQTSETVPRFISLNQIPSGLLPAAPAGGFPQVAPDAFAATSGIDSSIKSPYTMNIDFSIGRDLPHGFHIETSYVGRLSRRSLVADDVGMYTNLLDPNPVKLISRRRPSCSNTCAKIFLPTRFLPFHCFKIFSLVMPAGD